MAVKFASLASDLKKEDDGDWIEIPDLPGVSLKVRSFNFGPYRIARDQLIQRTARKYGRKPVPPEENEIEFGKMYAQYLLLDWKGFDIDYSAAAAREALSDPAFRDLRRHVEYAASQVAQAEVEFVEDALGESKPASAGKSSGNRT
jgi:hypothetical protein